MTEDEGVKGRVIQKMRTIVIEQRLCLGHILVFTFIIKQVISLTAHLLRSRLAFSPVSYTQ